MTTSVLKSSSAISRICAIVATVSMMAACAGRDAHPVATTQPQDNAAPCAAIQAEADANSARIAQLSREEGWKVAQNVGAGVVGLFTFGIGFAAMDFKDAAGTEREALETRNRYLSQLSLEKCKAKPSEDTANSVSSALGM